LLGTASFANRSAIDYVSSSIYDLLGIQIEDYSNDVFVNFNEDTKRLKLIFGTPQPGSITSFSDNGTFIRDRFNKVTDNYTVTANYTVNAYSLISASIYENGVQKANTGTNLTLAYSDTTTGSRVYQLQITSSNPSDQSVLYQSQDLSLTLNKTLPDTPTIAATPTVQLGATSNEMEQGSTGSVAYSITAGDANSWTFNFTRSNYTSPLIVTGSLTGSVSILIQATASYSSSGVNGSDNDPVRIVERYSTQTYSKIRSLRYGATSSVTFTQSQLEDLALWDTTLGGSIGTILKGTNTKAEINNSTITINWDGSPLYQYIAYDKSLGTLSQIKNAVGANELAVGGKFYNNLLTLNNYYVYKSNVALAGSTSVSYTLVFP
jgi:hypothetical protein